MSKKAGYLTAPYDPADRILYFDADDFRYVPKMVRRLDSIIDSLMAGSPNSDYLRGEATGLVWSLTHSTRLTDEEIRRLLMVRYERRHPSEVPAEEE